MKLKRLIAIIGITLIVVPLLWWKTGTQAVNPNNKKEIIFVVQPGSSVRTIAKKLKDQDLIKDELIFLLLVKKENLDKKIQSGDFKLSQSMTPIQIAKTLIQSPLDIWITIPEGKRAEEIAEILEQHLPKYNPSWKQALIKNEGYLFPDTYLIPKEATIDDIIAIMKKNFDEKYASIDTSNINLSQKEIVIIASLIEREVRDPQDLRLVSSVIHNRLAISMALQVDATIQYAKGKQNGKWWPPVTVAEYSSVISPYNTYLYPGLPPGPICNPGLAALQAAANPADTEYLYYITDKNGINRYARTNDQHNENIKKYGL